jgi:hypothetical protein
METARDWYQRTTPHIAEYQRVNPFFGGVGNGRNQSGGWNTAHTRAQIKKNGKILTIRLDSRGARTNARWQAIGGRPLRGITIDITRRFVARRRLPTRHRAQLKKRRSRIGSLSMRCPLSPPRNIKPSKLASCARLHKNRHRVVLHPCRSRGDNREDDYLGVALPLMLPSGNADGKNYNIRNTLAETGV